jgi:hypothetical protein
MRIGIIGAGNIGGTLTRRLTALGHEVRVANSRDPQTLAELAAETGATAVWATEVADDAELVIVSIPQGRVVDLPAGIVKGARPGAVVIETHNYYPGRDGRIDEIEGGALESVWVSQQLDVPVMKAFNCIDWKKLLRAGEPKGTPGRIAIPVAGDDEAGKQVVFDLIEQLGFDPIDGGSLADSWRQQPATPVYGTHLDADGARAALAEASPEQTAQFRA